MRLIGPALFFNLWNEVIQVSQHLSMLHVPQMFLKLARKPNNSQFLFT